MSAPAVAGTGRADDGLLRQVAGLTGFDSCHLDGTATGVAVVGVGGVGVRSLVEACRLVAPDLAVTARQPGETLTAGVGILVVDPSSSIGDEEVAMMARLRATVGTVALVCTKIDAFWEWPRILRAHRRLVDPAEQVPVFAVSSAAALAGATDESGVDELTGWVREALSAPTALRTERARVSAAQGAVDQLLIDRARAAGDGAAERDAAGLDAGTDSADTGALLQRRRVLLGARDRGRVDRLAAVRTGLARTRSRSLADAQQSARSLTAEALRRCADVRAGDVEAHAAWLRQAVADMAAGVEQRTTERLDETASSAQIGLDGGDGADADAASAGHAGDTGALAAAPHRAEGTGAGQTQRPLPTGRRGEDALLVLIGASTGLGIGRLVVAPMASVHTLQWISMPLTLVLGVAVAIWVIRVRRASVHRGELRTWSAEVITDARTRLERDIGLRVTTAESQMTGRIGRYYERRARQATDEVAAIDDRLRRMRDPDVIRAERQQRADLAGRADALRTALAERSRELWDTPHAPPAGDHPRHRVDRAER